MGRILVFRNFVVFVLLALKIEEAKPSNVLKDKFRTLRDRELRRFSDGKSSDFRNLQIDDGESVLYVGSVNRIYKLNVYNISQKLDEIDLSPEKKLQQNCLNYKGVPELCQNTIRVLQNVNSSTLYVCGTNAFAPRCSYVDKLDFKEIVETRERGKWRCPYSPAASTHSVMLNGTLFTATGNSITRSGGIVAKTLNNADLHTQESDLFVFHDPVFAGVYHVNSPDNAQDKVVMFLREKAEELPTEMLTQSAVPNYRLVQSRVATVCANDHGGKPWLLNDNFATFTKMRITCPAPTTGSDVYTLPYFYDEIQGTYMQENPEDPSNPYLYAVFATPEGSAAASATCVYSMNGIREKLSTNKYWNRDVTKNGFFSIFESSVGPAPDSCVPNTKSLSQSRLSFGKEHPVKYGVVKPDNNNGAVFQSSGKRFRHIIVDTVIRNEKEKNGDVENAYDVLYLISDDGEIKRIVRSKNDESVSWDLPSLHVFQNPDEKDKVLSVIKKDNMLFVGTNNAVVQIPMVSCWRYQNCKDCVMSRDPYCELDDVSKICSSISSNKRSKRCLKEPMDDTEMLQTFCPGGEPTEEEEESNSQDDVEEKIKELNKNITNLENQLIETNLKLRTSEVLRLEMNMNLTKCKTETRLLHGNLEKARERLGNHESAQRVAIQLYKDTVYSLNTCGEKSDNLMLRLEQEKRLLTSEQNRRIKLLRALTKEKQAHKKAKNSLQKCQEQVKMSGLIARDSPCQRISRELKVCKQKSVILRSVGANNTALSECVQLSTTQQETIDNLEAENNNLTRVNKQMEAIHKADVQNLQRIRWLHRKNGRRGEQKCEHKEWFVFQDTRRMFMLHKIRSTHNESEAVCAEDGGTLASFHDALEMRYVHNVLRAFEPNRHFWIGLVKHSNKTLEWTDGSILRPGDVERFPASQMVRLDNSNPYCSEVNKFQRWQLINCSRRRRPLCVKNYPGSTPTPTERTNQRSSQDAPDFDID